MMFFKKIWNPKTLIFNLIEKFGSDKLYLKVWFHSCMGYWMDFHNPQTFNEKLQWLKLYDRQDIYTTMVDKYAVKQYVENIIGKQYIVPTLGVWNSFDEINFDLLPEQFVLKCTHDSGGLVICKNKSKFQKSIAKSKIEKSLQFNYYKKSREWPYKNVPHRIIAEPFLEDDEYKELRDYKFFCFGGKVKAMFIVTNRQNNNCETCFDFFDRDFNHFFCINGHPMAEHTPKKPKNFEEMIMLAEELSQNLPHARIDFFEVNGTTLFGEITLFHHGGGVKFDPIEIDYKFGSWLDLPK